MEKVKSMNTEIIANDKEIESMIVELSEKQEFACTGQACGAKGCGVE